MEPSKNNNCNIRCCDCDSSFCQYHCAFPPIFLDNVYNRFRQPCLAIICILIMLVFGSQNIYGLTTLTCDQMYIVDPTCRQSDPFVTDNKNYTITILSKQNNIDYQITDAWRYNNDEPENSEFDGLNKYQIVTIIDKVFTVLLCIGNSPYHSPFWLIIGFVGTSWSTFRYTQSIEYCGNHCKTIENNKFYMPPQCNEYPMNPMCELHDDLCNQCQCLYAGNNSCMNYLNHNGPLDHVRIIISYIWFTISYFRQILTFSLILKIIYRFCCRRKHEDYTIFHCFDCFKCCKVFSKKRIVNDNKQQNSNDMDCLKNELLLIPIKTNNNKYSYGNWRNWSDKTNTYTNNKWYHKICDLFKTFINPLSIRLSVGSCICIIFLMISFSFWFKLIDGLLIDSIFSKYMTAKWSIISLLFIDAMCCCFIDLRCIYMIHHRFQSDVVAVYKFYNNAHAKDDNDDDKQIMMESVDSIGLIGYYEKAKKTYCWNPIKTLFITLFPSHIICGECIIENVKKCRIMNAYQFVFVYPLCVTLGCNALFIIVLIPILIIIILIYFIILGDWAQVLNLLLSVFQWTIRMLWPLIALKIFDYCILRGDTNKILTQRSVKCFWFITLIDSLSTFFSALFMGFYSVLFVRIGYSIIIMSIGLLTPYKSTLPKPFEINDSVYHSYCSTVALTALSLLKANEKQTFSDFAKQLKIQMLLQKTKSFQNKFQKKQLDAF